MTTERQRVANRTNARFSTGPRTKAGKKAVSRNAVRHGLSSQEHGDPVYLSLVSSLGSSISKWDFQGRHQEIALQIAEAYLDVEESGG